MIVPTSHCQLELFVDALEESVVKTKACQKIIEIVAAFVNHPVKEFTELMRTIIPNVLPELFDPFIVDALTLPHAPSILGSRPQLPHHPRDIVVLATFVHTNHARNPFSSNVIKPEMLQSRLVIVPASLGT